MRFRENTCLHFLQGLTPDMFRIGQSSPAMTQAQITAFGLSLVPVFNRYKELFAQNIYYLTDPFENAWDRGAHRLVDVFGKEDMSENGTLIRSVKGGVNTIFYIVDTFTENDIWFVTAMFLIFHKTKEMDKPSLQVFVSFNKNIEKSHFSTSANELGVTSISVMADMSMFILFKKYCEIETKIVLANTKAKHVGQKYLNETKSNIQILDSTWFTTIIRSEGFGVEGHFRLQPCGPKLSQKKLIYIAPFQKEGYTKKAIILNQTV